MHDTDRVTALYPDSVVQAALRVVTLTRINVAVLDAVKAAGGYGYPDALEVVRWIQR